MKHIIDYRNARYQGDLLDGKPHGLGITFVLSKASWSILKISSVSRNGNMELSMATVLLFLETPKFSMVKSLTNYPQASVPTISKTSAKFSAISVLLLPKTNPQHPKTHPKL